MVIGSKELIRDMNSKLVLETIMKENGISRASISKQLGLTKATISAIVSDLINAGLVLESGSDDTMLGRKPILLCFHQSAGIAAAIDISLSSVSILVTDLKGENRMLKRIRTPDKADFTDRMIELLESMLASADKTSYGLVGITIGIHGIVSDNRIVFSPYYQLKDNALAEQLSSFFNVPVILENEANLSVIGESTYLKESYKNLANISIHSGVGAGLLLNRRLYTGSHGYAGEIGHTTIQLGGRPCPCGSLGCLEQYLSEQALLKEYASFSGISMATLDEFVKAYRKKDEAALLTAEHFVQYMNICLINLLHCFDPDIIIINSSFTILFPELIDQISSTLNQHTITPVTVISSKLEDQSILIGGICLAVKSFLGIVSIHAQ